MNNLLDKNGILNHEAMEKLNKKATDTSCECPEQLISLLRSIKNFTEYQDSCLINKPSDQLTHQWLKSTSINLEHLVSNTIISLARMEGLIDDNNDIII